MSRVVVDSSVFVAYYWAKDTQHEKAVHLLLNEFPSATLIIHPYVIQEVATVLVKRLNLAVAKKFLAEVSRGSNVEIVWVNVQEDMAGFQTLTSPISFTDITLIRLAKSMNTELITFDRQMLSLYAK